MPASRFSYFPHYRLNTATPYYDNSVLQFDLSLLYVAFDKTALSFTSTQKFEKLRIAMFCFTICIPIKILEILIFDSHHSSILIIFRLEIISVRYFCPSNSIYCPLLLQALLKFSIIDRDSIFKENGLEFGLTMILSNLYQHITRVIKSSNIVKASSGLLSSEVLLTPGK